jgi:ribonucleoside-triphosphate reductase
LENLWQVTAKYGFPNFANFINSDMSVADARSMCCRLRLDLRHLEKRGAGRLGANPLTGAIGVVTFNMPRLGYISADEGEFVERLDRLMDLARSSLEIKRKLLERLTDRNLYPYTRFYLRSVKEHYDQYWHNHFSTIGLVGMNEAGRNLLGKDIGTAEGRSFAARILDHMRARLLAFQEETGNLYNLEATPAEGTSYRLARLDRQKYPDIASANTSPQAGRNEPFYSNSTQLPVNYTDDIWEVLELQDDLQARYTGGTGLHINLGEAVADPGAVKQFVRKVCTNYRLPYFTISPVFSICTEHGYLHGRIQQCPHCGRKTEVYARVVGYLRPVDQWNEGKQAEFEQRRYFRIKATS